MLLLKQSGGAKPRVMLPMAVTSPQSRKETKMGETYRSIIGDVMNKYEKVWNDAIVEFDRNGQISDETEEMLRNMEMKMALLGAI